MANSNWSTRTPARSSTSSPLRSPSSPTTARAFAARPTNLRSLAMSRCCATSAPRPEPADQRRHRAILRHVEVRAPLPRPDRRRRRASDGDRPLPRHLQPHPASPSSRRSNAAPGLPRHVTQRPTEGPVTATRHGAGSYETSRHRVGRRRLSAPLLCRWRFTCETARAASVGALGHGRLPGSYEELVAAR